METLARIKEACEGGASIELKEFRAIVDYLIGRTARSVKDSEIESACKDALAEWQK